jgi:oxaloacetate decarboxylase alpha subunit
MDDNRAQRVQEIVQIVQESGIGEVTIEEDGMRISVRATPDLADVAAGEAPLAVPREPDQPPTTAVSGTLLRVESPMVGTFYRAGQPGAPPFVEVGDVVAPGQTLCILEAMKLMNEVKAEVEGVVRGIHAENAAPVEFGQLLFELEPLVGRPTL